MGRSFLCERIARRSLLGVRGDLPRTPAGKGLPPKVYRMACRIASTSRAGPRTRPRTARESKCSGRLEIVQRASRLIPRSRLLSGMVGFDGCLMKNFSISAAILFTATLGVCAASAQAQGDKPTIVRLDPALDALVSPDAKLQLVKGGFGFTE